MKTFQLQNCDDVPSSNSPIKLSVSFLHIRTLFSMSTCYKMTSTKKTNLLYPASFLYNKNNVHIPLFGEHPNADPPTVLQTFISGFFETVTPLPTHFFQEVLLKTRSSILSYIYLLFNFKNLCFIASLALVLHNIEVL